MFHRRGNSHQNQEEELLQHESKVVCWNYIVGFMELDICVAAETLEVSYIIIYWKTSFHYFRSMSSGMELGP